MPKEKAVTGDSNHKNPKPIRKLFNMVKDVLVEIVDDIEKWLKINKPLVKQYILLTMGFISFVLFICLGFFIGSHLSEGGQIALFVIYGGIFGITYLIANEYFETHVEKPKRQWALYYNGHRQTPFYFADSNEEAVERGEVVLQKMKEEMGEAWERAYPLPLWEIKIMDND
jgi:lipopolysaccharide export LptBFGC system permease protein LptF